MSAIASPQSYLGSMKNRELVRDILVDKVAPSTKIKAGDVTYLTATGRKPVDDATASSSVYESVRVAEFGADNSGNATDGPTTARVTTYKTGAIICVKAEDGISVDSRVQAGEEGGVKQLAELGASSTLTNMINHYRRGIGYYLGKPGEVDEVQAGITGASRSDAVEDDEVFIVLD